MTDTFDEYKVLVAELNTQKQYYAANMINALIERCKKAELDKSNFRQYLDNLFVITDNVLDTFKAYASQKSDRETINMINHIRPRAKK